MELVTGERDTGVPHCPDSDCDSVSISVHGLCPRKVIYRENHIISARIGRALHFFQAVSHPNMSRGRLRVEIYTLMWKKSVTVVLRCKTFLHLESDEW